MDSFTKAKLKNENSILRSQLADLTRKLDIVNNLLNKHIQNNQKQDQLILNLKEELDQYTVLISFIKLKNNIIRLAKIDEEELVDDVINQFIINNQNSESLKKIFPTGAHSKDYHTYFHDLRELYARIVYNSTN